MNSALSDAGTATFSSGDQVTVGYDQEITVSGGLTTNGTTFIDGGAGANITFTSTATLGGGGNAFSLPIYVPYTLVPSLAGNASFDQVYIEAGTISSGTLALDLIGSNANMSYVFASGFTVAAGGAMAVGANVAVVVNSALSDAGTATFSSGDQVTVGYNQEITVSGGLTTNGTTFIDGGGSNITFTSTATLGGGSNAFSLPIYVPYTLVPSLAGNASFDQVYIEAGTISSGTLSLDLIGSNANMSYVFASGFTVAAGGAMAVGANVAVVVNSTLSDAGTATFSSGDQVTVDYNQEISVSGGLTANGTTFINGGGSQHHIHFDRDPQRRQQHLQPADLRPLHPRPVARGQCQLRSGLYRSRHHLQRHPGAQPDRQQREHELRIRQRLHRGRRWSDGGRCQRAGRGGLDAERRGDGDLLQR